MIVANRSGSDSAIAVSRLVTVAVSWTSIREISRNRDLRSTRVINAERPSVPMIRSPSQCPGMARSAAAGGRLAILASPIQDLFDRGPSLERGLRLVRC